jgi:hypothetical protein
VGSGVSGRKEYTLSEAEWNRDFSRLIEITIVVKATKASYFMVMAVGNGADGRWLFVEWRSISEELLTFHG